MMLHHTNVTFTSIVEFVQTIPGPQGPHTSYRCLVLSLLQPLKRLAGSSCALTVTLYISNKCMLFNVVNQFCFHDQPLHKHKSQNFVFLLSPDKFKCNRYVLSRIWICKLNTLKILWDFQVAKQQLQLPNRPFPGFFNFSLGAVSRNLSTWLKRTLQEITEQKH